MDVGTDIWSCGVEVYRKGHLIVWGGCGNGHLILCGGGGNGHLVLCGGGGDGPFLILWNGVGTDI